MDKAYKIFYNHFLSELPEGLAIPLGRNLLRLPMEYLDIYEAKGPELGISLGGCELSNPVILSACYHEPWIIRKLSRMGFGAVTLKVTKEPRKGNPRPNIVRRDKGFVNCLGFRNPGKEKTGEFLKEYKGVPIILNVTGDSIGEYCDVVDFLQDYVDMIELNISCPNTENGLYFSENHGQAKELFSETRKLTGKPMIVKLTRGDHKDIISNAIDSGIGIVNYGNTLPVKEGRLSAGAGGLSGPGLYDDTVGSVKRIREEFGDDLQIIATGGIDSGEKACEVMENGADAVSYISGFITRGPFLAREINEYMSSV